MSSQFVVQLDNRPGALAGLARALAASASSGRAIAEVERALAGEGRVLVDPGPTSRPEEGT